MSVGRSCPSTGPTVTRPNFSNQVSSAMASLAISPRRWYISPMIAPPGRCETTSRAARLTLRYAGLTRMRSKYAASAPWGRAMDMPLSLKTTRNCRFSVPALFIPSMATPLTMLASPTRAHT